MPRKDLEKGAAVSSIDEVKGMREELDQLGERLWRSSRWKEMMKMLQSARQL